jgi:hypothetical protein
MHAKYLVLISGRQGAGKTTLQKLLIEKRNALSNHRAAAVNFADILYEMHDAVRAVGDKYGIMKKNPKDGPLLQVLGTEWGRNTIGDNIWVDALKKKIDLVSVREGVFAYDQSLFVVGDCRFRNEFDAFPKALRIRLNCMEALRRERCSMWRDNSSHPSEVDLDGYNEEFKFDKYFDTRETPALIIAESVIDTLHQNAWLENRK